MSLDIFNLLLEVLLCNLASLLLAVFLLQLLGLLFLHPHGSVLDLELAILSLRNHLAHVTLQFDHCPHLLVVLPAHQVTPAPGLKPDDVTAQVPELMAKHAGPDQSLESHVTRAHLQVLLPAVVGPEVPLDDDGGLAHLQEPSPVVPTADAALENQNLLGQHAIPFLFKEEIMGILEEDLAPSQLVIGLAENCLANLGGGCSAVVVRLL